MIHHMPSIETLDPRLQDVYKGMRPPNTPKYGLGYIEQCDQVIPDCRFNNPLPPSIQRPTITKIHKFHSIMMGCPKATIEEAWIKKMLNWNLFTHPESKEFNLSIPKEKKTCLSQEWQTFISEKNLWISFYVWRQKSQNPAVQMLEAGKESSSRHEWKNLERKLVESTSTFPPFKGIILEDGNKQVRAVPLMLANEDAQLSGLERKL